MCALIFDAHSDRPWAAPPPGAGEPPRPPEGEPGQEGHARDRGHRILLVDHGTEPADPFRIRTHVSVEWMGIRSTGEAVGGELAQSRQRAVAEATLRAVATAVEAAEEGLGRPFQLELEGVSTVEIEDHAYVLLSVHARTGRDATRLASAVAVRQRGADLPVILAALKATDRWLRRPRPS